MGTSDARRRLAGEVNRRMWEQGLTQTELSRRSGVSKTYLSMICSAQVLPSDWTVLKLAKALGCSCEDLIGEKVKPQPKPQTSPEADLFKLFVAYGGFKAKKRSNKPWKSPRYVYVPFGKEKD